MKTVDRPKCAFVSVVAILYLLSFGASSATGQKFEAQPQSKSAPVGSERTQAGSNEAQQRSIGQSTKETPKHIPGGFDLPNGWRITPAGRTVDTLDDLTLDDQHLARRPNRYRQPLWLPAARNRRLRHEDTEGDPAHRA